MDFQVKALSERRFEHLFGADAATLARHAARRLRAPSSPGYPCRVRLRDAGVGESVLLVNHVHHDEDTPYRASHAIFVIEHAVEARPAPNEVPDLLRTRLLSVRAYDRHHDMIAADVCEGLELERAIGALGHVSGCAYLHVHNARPGCFAARIDLLS